MPWWVWMLDAVAVLLVVGVGVVTNQVLNNGDWGSLAWGWLVADLALAGAASVVTHKTSAARAARTDASAGLSLHVEPDRIANVVTERSSGSVIKARKVTINTINQYGQALTPRPLPHVPIPPKSGAAPAIPARAGPRRRPVPRSEAAGQVEPMLDRGDDQDGLRALLTRGTGGIVVVYGQPGVGKTALVDAVLADIERSGRSRIHRHEVIPGIPLDVRTLTDDLTHETAAPNPSPTKPATA